MMVSDILVDWERMQMTLSLYSLGYETLINAINAHGILVASFLLKLQKQHWFLVENNDIDFM